MKGDSPIAFGGGAVLGRDGVAKAAEGSAKVYAFSAGAESRPRDPTTGLLMDETPAPGLVAHTE